MRLQLLFTKRAFYEHVVYDRAIYTRAVYARAVYKHFMSMRVKKRHFIMRFISVRL